MRLEVEAPYKLDYLQTMNSESGEQLTQLEQFPTKILTVEVPTTKMANTNYNVNQTITVYYPSEYVIVFPQIPKEEIEAMPPCALNRKRREANRSI